MRRPYPSMPDLEYTESVEGVAPEQRAGFFVGWPSPPSPEPCCDAYARLGFFTLPRGMRLRA